MESTDGENGTKLHFIVVIVLLAWQIKYKLLIYAVIKAYKNSWWTCVFGIDNEAG